MFFSSITPNTPSSAVLTQSNVSNSQNIIIQGANIISNASNVVGINSLYPIQSTTYWDINMTVIGSGVASGSATYTVYYYGLS
jgi:type 1 fimbria pilin